MITIEPLGADDFGIVARWLATPSINRWLTADWREKPANPTIVAIAVRNRRNRFFLVRFSGEPCGVVALSDVDATDKTGMVWYLLGESRLSGQGITSHAVADLIRISFRELGLRALYAWAMEENAASRRVLAKAGFREAGRLRQSASLEGRQTDRIYFDLIADDFTPRNVVSSESATVTHQTATQL
jgi:RimJ/RimL family protein N-acetyltransferase